MLRHGGVRLPNGAALRMGGGGHSDVMQPPFVQRALDKGTIHEHDELVWDDGVAPETCLDFDAPHISKSTGGLWWLGGFGFFLGLGLYQRWKDPEGLNPAAPRRLPANGAFLALGGDPEKAGAEDE